MLRLVRTNQPLIIIILLVYAFVLRSYQFIQPASWTNTNDNFLSDVVLNYVGTSSVWANIIALLLVFFQAIMVNSMVNLYKMTIESTYYPALFYILLASAIPDFLYLSPVLMAATFYIIALMELFKWYKNYEASSEIFNVGFWLAIGSLFYFSISVYFVLGVVGLSVLRSFRPNELLVLFIGLLVPYFLLGVYYFWIDELPQFLDSQIYSNASFLDIQISNTTYAYLKVAFFAIFIIWTVSRASNLFFKQSIQNQKNIVILFWSIAVTFLIFLFQKAVSLEVLLLFAVPLSYTISSNLLNMKKRFMPELIHVLMLAALFTFQYKEYVLGVFLLD